jgi:hypothetical protein
MASPFATIGKRVHDMLPQQLRNEETVCPISMRVGERA